MSDRNIIVDKKYDVFEFIRGQADCRDGVVHKDQGESYNAGYSAQYELEQNMEAMSHGN